MAVTGVVTLTELISNQSLGQSQEVQAAQGESNVAAKQAGDRFTPSTQTGSTQTTAQDAGLFQVSQYALTTANAEALTAQVTAPAAAQNPIPAPAAEIATTTLTTQSPATILPSEPAAAPSVAAPPQATANAAAQVPVNTQDQVQSLNAVLLGLGLSNGDIKHIDRIASVTKAFNPALYGDLIQQFEAQAEPQTSVPTEGNQPLTQSSAPRA